MGKPIVHMIPSQEARLRGNVSNSKTASAAATKKAAAKNSKLSPLAASSSHQNGVKRSPTNVSIASSKTSKSYSSNESGISSFVHSDSSYSTSPSSDSVNMSLSRGGGSQSSQTGERSAGEVKTNKNDKTLVPESISTTKNSNPNDRSTVSVSSKIKVAIENYEEGIEITRQKSSSASSLFTTRKRLGVQTIKIEPFTRSSGSNKVFRNKKAKKAVKAASPTTRQRPVVIRNQARKISGETTTASENSELASSVASPKKVHEEECVRNSRFEDPLDDIAKEKDTKKSPQELEEIGIEVDVSTMPKSGPNFSINPKLLLGRKNHQRPSTTRGRRSRKRQQSIPAARAANINSSELSSSMFFSAIDKHVETRLRSRLDLVQLNDSIEVLKSSRVEQDVVLALDDTVTTPSETNKTSAALNSFLSPCPSVSKPNGARQVPSVTDTTTAALQVPPPPDPFKKKKKIYSITGGKLVVEEVDECEAQGAIEVKHTGSVIMDQQQQKQEQSQEQQEESNIVANIPSIVKTAEDSIKKPDRLLRLEESKTPTKSVIAKGFLKISKRPKNASQSLFPRVKVDDENVDGAIELLRSPTKASSNKSFSDDDDEDTILKQVSPPTSPDPGTESLQIVGQDNDIEIVAPASTKSIFAFVETSPQGVSDSFTDEKILKIRKINSQDGSITSSASVTPKTLPPIPKPPTNDTTAAPPKKFEPVVETPSNRVEDNNVVDVTQDRSSSTHSTSSLQSNMETKDSSIVLPLVDTTDETEASPPENGDQLTFVGKEQTIPKITKAVMIPRIPAPKKDTTCKSLEANKKSIRNVMTVSSEAASKNVFSLEESSKKKKTDENVNNIDISAQCSEPESKVSTLVKKYSTMVVKEPLHTQEKSSHSGSADESGAKHIVHVNVLGVAGIVVDRKNCRDVSGNRLSPSPPEEMTAVVGISESNGDSVDNVTTFSSPLIHAPMTKDKQEGDSSKIGTQRHIAVWASNGKGETPGSAVQSKMLNLQSCTQKGSKNSSKFVNLNVALTKDDEDTHHAAIVIGKARIKITEEMIKTSQNKTIDLPVTSLTKDESSSQNYNRVILLRTAPKQQNGVRKLCVEKLSEEKENEVNKDLSSAYTIDPAGDSMIRIQIRVEEILATSKWENFQRSGSFTNIAADTEQTDESSIRSGISPEHSKDGNMYSKALNLQSPFVKNDATFQVMSWKENAVMVDSEPTVEEGSGCKIFGRKIGLPCSSSKSKKGLVGQIDERIEDMAEHVFSCPGPNIEESSLAGEQTYATKSHSQYTGGTGFTQRKILDEMKSVLEPVPSLSDLRNLAKEFALSSGEYFFPENTEKALGVDDEEENTSVESAAQEVVRRRKFSSRKGGSIDSWKKRRDDDDVTYSTGGSENESDASYSLNHSPFGEEPNQFSFDNHRRVMSESNKFDIDFGDRSKDVVGKHSFNSFQEDVGQLDVGCEGDDEESAPKGRTPLADVDLEEDKNDRDLKRENSGKPSLPSVVENIAEVLSIGGKACGYYSADRVDHGIVRPMAIWNRRSKSMGHQIPKTVDQSDIQSVGELTAITLEKNEIKEKNRKLLMKRLGLPKEVVAFVATGGKAAANSTEGESNELEDQASGSNNSAENSEDYFSEYNDVSSDVNSIYVQEIPKQKNGVETASPPMKSSRSSEGKPNVCMIKIKEGDESEVESV